MTGKNPIVHFEIPVADPEKSQEFYTSLFDWEIKKFDMPGDGSTEGEPYYMVYTSPVNDKHMPTEKGAINGGMMKRKAPGQPFMNYIKVESISDMLPKIEEKGGKICLPKTQIGEGMGWIAAFQDIDGNMMGLHEFPEKQ